MRRTAIGGEVCQQALSPLVSLPFVARAVALDGRGVAHGDRCAALAAVASRVCRLPQGARRRDVVASCASASNGSSADDSVKPNAAPKSKQGKRLSSRDHFRFDFLVHFPSPCHSRLSNWIGGKLNAITSVSGRKVPAIRCRPETQSDATLSLARPSSLISPPARDNVKSPRLAIVAPANPTTKVRLN